MLALALLQAAVVEKAATRGVPSVFGHASTKGVASVGMLTQVQAMKMTQHLSFRDDQRGYLRIGACRLQAAAAQCPVGEHAFCMRCPDLEEGFGVEYCWACCGEPGIGTCHHDAREHNKQNPNYRPPELRDHDRDGILNIPDTDDDNDGILDVDEGNLSLKAGRRV